jgi:putative flippase GtrA
MIRILNKSLIRQFLRFMAVGATGTAVQYVVLWFGTSVLFAKAAICSAAGYILGSVVNYLLNYIFTFKSGKSHLETASKYYMVLGVGWCINTGLMGVFVHGWKWNVWISQILTTGIGLAWNFTGSKWFAFKHHSADVKLEGQ